MVYSMLKVTFMVVVTVLMMVLVAFLESVTATACRLI